MLAERPAAKRENVTQNKSHIRYASVSASLFSDRIDVVNADPFYSARRYQPTYYLDDTYTIDTSLGLNSYVMKYYNLDERVHEEIVLDAAGLRETFVTHRCADEPPKHIFQ